MSRLNALHTLPAKSSPATGFWAKGKSLIAFYKTGITNVWQNRRLLQEIRQKYGISSGTELARSIVENSHLAGITKAVLKQQEQQNVSVTRDELLTSLRTERDFKKLPMFVVIFAICFEMTPIVSWGFPRIAPSTCWSASFNESLRSNYEHNRMKLGVMNELAAKSGTQLDGSESVFRLPLPVLSQLASILDFGHHFRFSPTSSLRHRVARHLLEVRADDAISRQNLDNLDESEPEELKRALMSRCSPSDGGVSASQKWVTEFVEPMDAGFFCVQCT